MKPGLDFHLAIMVAFCTQELVPEIWTCLKEIGCSNGHAGLVWSRLLHCAVVQKHANRRARGVVCVTIRASRLTSLVWFTPAQAQSIFCFVRDIGQSWTYGLPYRLQTDR